MFVLVPCLARYAYDPTYELTYWKWGIDTAATWNARRRLPHRADWADVYVIELLPLFKMTPHMVMSDVFVSQRRQCVQNTSRIQHKTASLHLIEMIDVPGTPGWMRRQPCLHHGTHRSSCPYTCTLRLPFLWRSHGMPCP